MTASPGETKRNTRSGAAFAAPEIKAAPPPASVGQKAAAINLCRVKIGVRALFSDKTIQMPLGRRAVYYTALRRNKLIVLINWPFLRILGLRVLRILRVAFSQRSFLILHGIVGATVIRQASAATHRGLTANHG
jgi:hypothetical protein